VTRDQAQAVPYQAHSAPSRAAADAVAPRAPTARQAVLRALRAAGRAGLTDEQVADRTGLREGTARARRVKLVELGCVTDSGQRRPTTSGCQATVWVAVALGEQLELTR